MPYALYFEGLNDQYVRNNTSAVSIVDTDDFVIEFEWEQDNNSNFGRVLGGDTIDSRSPRVLFFGNSSTVRLTSGDGTDYEWGASHDLTQRTIWRFERTNGVLDLYINGAKISGTKTEAFDSFNMNLIGGNFGNTTNAGLLYYATFIVNGVVQKDYQPSLSNGTGSVLPDATGGPSATLIQFPSDDSQWVFYSTGAAGPDTPINPSVTNLLATSARLNWEQG